MKTTADMRAEFWEVVRVSKKFLTSLNDFKDETEHREEVAYQRGYKAGFDAGQQYERCTNRLSFTDLLTSYWHSFRGTNKT